MSPLGLSSLCCCAMLASARIILATAPCDEALARGAVCEAANQRALELMRTSNLDAIAVMQDVKTGRMVAFAASNPAKLDVTSPLVPLSSVKLMVAASALDHEDMKIMGWPESEKLLNDSLVSGNDNAGRRIASDLRMTVGTDKVLQDMERYGFPPCRGNAVKRDPAFWAELPPRWRDQLIPASACHSLGQETGSRDWADTLSLGEERFIVTVLHLSRFLQAVGNEGVMLPAAARDEAQPGSMLPAPATRVMSETAALNLQATMRGAVEAAPRKASKAVGPGSDGCFAGLIFDPQGKARFTVVTFVRHGGVGGGNAARISAELARFLTGVP